MVGRIADWITIITAPIAILTTIGAWVGKLDEISQSSQRDSMKPEILAAVLIIFVWCFFFFAQLRLYVLFYRKLSETASLYLSYLVALVGLSLSTAVELLILDSLVPATQWPLIMMVWLGLPFILWIVGSLFAASIVTGGLFEKEDS
jgi:hypothetical protein